MNEYKVEPGTTLQEAVFVALGAASTCWDDMSGTGTFDEARARKIGDELVDAILNGRVHDQGTGLGVQVSRWWPLDGEGRPV